MKNLVINYDKVTSVAIAGNSGSGKSYTLTYLLSVLKNISDLIIVDPKFDTPSRWAKQNQIAVIHPKENRSKSDFVSEINESLSQCLSIIHKRQGILLLMRYLPYQKVSIKISKIPSSPYYRKLLY